MRTRIKPFPIVFCALFLVFYAFGCSANNKSKEQPSQNSGSDTLSKEKDELLSYSGFISSSDELLVKDKGEGNASSVNVNGVSVIIARGYKGTLFGYTADVIYTLGDGKTVSDIIFRFADASKDAVEEKLASTLGEPLKVTEESDKTNLEEQWVSNGYKYSLLDDGTSVTLSIYLNPIITNKSEPDGSAVRTV